MTLHPSIRVKPRISERAACNMIVQMAMYGNHYNDIYHNIKTVTDVREHYRKNGMDFNVVVNKCRDFRYHVPIYENLLGAQRTIQGCALSKVDHITGDYKEIVSGDGTYNEADYWALFDLSYEDFEHALEAAKYERFLSAVNSGMASIETFLNHQYFVRMHTKSDSEVLKKDIETKVDEWIPLLTGKRYDKGGRDWAAFKKLKSLRNEHFQHRKSVASGITFLQLVDLLNEFKYGICRILMEFHKIFAYRCPTIIIRCSYYPEIIYVKNESPRNEHSRAEPRHF